MFDINNYPGNYCMHCATEEEALEFCQYLDNVGRTWNGGDSYLSFSNYNVHGNETVYHFNEGTYGDRDYALMSNCIILEWSLCKESRERIAKLSEVPRGARFEIEEYGFIKLDDMDNAAVIISCKPFLNSAFGETQDFSRSDILPKLISDVLPIMEELVGAENVLEFETDLKSHDNPNKYLDITSKVSIPTYKEYQDYCLRNKIYDTFWLCTAYNRSVLSCSVLQGVEGSSLDLTKNVYPVFHLNSSIEVNVNY